MFQPRSNYVPQVKVTTVTSMSVSDGQKRQDILGSTYFYIPKLFKICSPPKQKFCFFSAKNIF